MTRRDSGLKVKRTHGRRTSSASRKSSRNAIVRAYDSAYKQESSDIDKAINTLISGKEKNLRSKYQKYLEMANA